MSFLKLVGFGEMGREEVLAVKRGNIELPSDLAGVDVENFNTSPTECVASLYTFVEHLITSESMRLSRGPLKSRGICQAVWYREQSKCW